MAIAKILSAISLVARCALLVSMTALAACQDNVDADIVLASNVLDFTQTDVAGSQHGDGQMYCAPVAVSNSLSALFGSTRQVGLIKKLAGAGYMNTSLKNGTGTVGVLRGVERSMRENGHEKFFMRYQGWRKHLTRYDSGIREPSKDFLRHYVGKNSAAWINIGWYKKKGNDLKRVGGHWITLVGYHQSADNDFYVHDPSPRAGTEPRRQKITLQKLASGRLIGKKYGLPRNATGYLQVTSGLDLSRRADMAIIDGIVGLRW